MEFFQPLASHLQFVESFKVGSILWPFCVGRPPNQRNPQCAPPLLPVNVERSSSDRSTQTANQSNQEGSS